jgi:hypothetical protein
MGRGPKAGYRGGALQSRKPAAIDETPGRLINSRAATTQNAQKLTPTWARKTRRGDPGGHGSTPVFLKSCKMDLLRQAGM